ncbi:MAG: ECF transporter S component [Rikenellaceae bacterium]
MRTSELQLYSLSYSQAKTYLLALAFVVGNVLLPQIAHLVPQGGFIFLPIYFFTLLGAYKYGWRVGLLTAIFSPLVNNMLFGMPMIEVLPAILVKSTLLALVAGFAATHFKKASLAILSLVVISYQVVGTLVEWAIVGDFMLAVQDFRIGIPGMLLQIFGVYFIIKYIANK